YNLQRLGPNHPAIADDLGEIDRVVGGLIQFFENRRIEVMLVSEYGISEVDKPVHINRVLREKGFIAIKDELGLEQLDCGASRAFAMADHQVAHVYVNDESAREEVRAILEGVDGVESVWGDEEKAIHGMDHRRSGDFVVTAEERAWFTYYYWLDDAVAPDFARCVDIHRKAGYDPVELFIDPQLKFPMLKVAKFLLKKKMGFRALMDVIPLDAGLVRGSHGRVPSDESEWPLLIGKGVGERDLDSGEVYEAILKAVRGSK
ncbi:MAG: alkaline phosphatase family protein, partial [Verrucomicrobiota bacterium]